MGSSKPLAILRPTILFWIQTSICMHFVLQETRFYLKIRSSLQTKRTVYQPNQFSGIEGGRVVFLSGLESEYCSPSLSESVLDSLNLGRG